MSCVSRRVDLADGKSTASTTWISPFNAAMSVFVTLNGGWQRQHRSIYSYSLPSVGWMLRRGWTVPCATGYLQDFQEA
jgi:hypothetical protein